MKKIVAAFLVFLFHSSSVFANPSVELTDIYKLIADKNYEKALSGMQTYFEETRSIQELSAVRLSFGLSTWAGLNAVYPPAQQALDDISKKLQERVNAGKADSSEIHEYTSVNSYLKKDERTIESFEIISAKYSEKAKSFFIFAKNILIAAKRYDLLKKYSYDPIYDFEQIRWNRELDISNLHKGNTYLPLEKINATFKQKVNELVSLSTAIGLNEEAAEIKLRSDDYMKHYETGKFTN